jgi:alginate O-acetyltransferase complex protein AlgI
MIFTELRFLGFFVAVFALHWALRGDQERKWLLLAASWWFYAAWDWRYLGLLLLSTAIDYTAARGLDALSQGPYDAPKRRMWLCVSLGANLGILCAFKYYDFFVGSAAALFDLDVAALGLVLPLGISFFTFQTMSYTIDVYRRTTRAAGALDVALFVAFFPQLVAGPIVRARDLLPQLAAPRRFAVVPVRAALGLFLIGYVKKAAVADNLAPIVDAYFADPAAYDAHAAWIAVTSYAAQIYCDFSGYSDMAIATAWLLGYELGRNFDAPYAAASVTEFWRRWHLSLSSWLRDYVYIPLGGNRCGAARTYRNLLLTMLIGGLWHGAAWTFVAWGGLHGLALALERALGVQERRGAARVFGAAATFVFVCAAWVCFRSQDFATAGTVLRAYLLFDGAGAASFPGWLWGVLLALATAHTLAQLGQRRGWWRALPDWLFAIGWGSLAALAIAASPIGSRPFIYFQF